MLRRIARWYSSRARRRRGVLFREKFRPTETDRILDLGSEDGAHIAALIPFRENVYLADIDAAAMERGQRRFGFGHTLLLRQNATVDVPDKYFDIVFCSSVIEHVTVDKGEIGSFKTNEQFARAALDRQRRFANEIRRIGKRYFVQTPNRYFWIESHTWLPVFFVLLPRAMQARIVRITTRFWPKKTQLDFHLLTPALMAELFPDAEIVVEKSLGLSKSIMACKV